jgi:CubicO group peptidase (beta-lactamase class C family)
MGRIGPIAALLALLSACGPAHPGKSPGIEKHAGARDLYRFAEAQRRKHGLPALGVGIIYRGRIAGLGMAGERAAGSGEWATLDDAFDVASCSKSVTATLAAMLVEQDKIRWDTRIDEVFPELKGVIHPGFAGATLAKFLSHRAGLQHELNRNDRWAGWHQRH